MNHVSIRHTTFLFDIGVLVRKSVQKNVTKKEYLEKMQTLVDLGSNLISHRGHDFRTLLSQGWHETSMFNHANWAWAEENKRLIYKMFLKFAVRNGMNIATLPSVFSEFDKKYLANFQAKYSRSLIYQHFFTFKTNLDGRLGKAMLRDMF